MLNKPRLWYEIGQTVIETGGKCKFHIYSICPGFGISSFPLVI